jgi:transcriptional regulator with XRE-family HTH domain
MKLTTESNFSNALRRVRRAKGMTQEDFDQVSSRVYVSALERGIKQPTLSKVDALAAVLGVHPLTLLALSYSTKLSADDVKRLCERIATEVDALSSL